jgi:hypothetical protein
MVSLAEPFAKEGKRKGSFAQSEERKRTLLRRVSEKK